MVDYGELREEYDSSPLRVEDLDRDPFVQLSRWLKAAIECGVKEPNAMVLSTSSREGIPSSRTILIKSVTSEGLTFFTNYSSRKGVEIAANPMVSLTTYWRESYSQVTIDGMAEKLSDEESTRYFQSRPRETQIGAWSSPQGKEIQNRGELEEAFESYMQKFSGKEVPRPPHWGGFIIRPTQFIFWRGRSHRLHDRFLYREERGSWKLSRIAP